MACKRCNDTGRQMLGTTGAVTVVCSDPGQKIKVGPERKVSAKKPS